MRGAPRDIRALILGRPDIDRQCDGQCHHPATKMAVSELPTNRNGLLRSGHVVGIRSDIVGVRGGVVVGKKIGHGKSMGHRAVGNLGVGQADGGGVVARRVRRGQRGAAGQRQLGFFGAMTGTETRSVKWALTAVTSTPAPTTNRPWARFLRRADR